MFRDITFGQYYPVSSPIHRMDPRTKIVLSLVYLVGVLLIKSFFGFGLILVLIATMIVFSNIPVKMVIKSLKPILFLLLFTALLNLFFVSEGNVVFQLWFLRITDGGIIFCVRMILRLTFLVMGASFLTLTTTPVDLTHGIEVLLKPLNAIKFPVHELALIMSIALRFIPSLLEETDRIIRAQKARGADFESGNVFKRAKAFIPILIPLLISSFRRADDLALAMDARCYGGGKGRTKMKILKLSYRDFLGFFVVVAFFSAVVVLNVLEPSLIGQLPWMFF